MDTLSQPDFLIIGAGLIGLSTAYALIERGYSVQVLDARDGPARGTSFANSGMVHTSFADPWNSPGVWKRLALSVFEPASPMKVRISHLPANAKWGRTFLKYAARKRHKIATEHNFRLAVYSADLIARWRNSLSINDGYKRQGLLKVFRDQRSFETARKLAAPMIDGGLQAQILEGADIIANEPALGAAQNTLYGGLFFKQDYAANAHAFCLGLEKEILKRGGVIEYNVRATSLMVEGDKIIGAQTGKGARRAGGTIICAGAHSTNLLSPLGMKLALRPVKGYSLSFDRQDDQDGIWPSYPINDDGRHTAITPLTSFGKDGEIQTLRIAGTAEFGGFDTDIPRARIAPLFAHLRALYPDIAKNWALEDGRAWAGHRPMSADGSPFIGPGSFDGLWVNTGQGHLGWTFSAGSGVMLADMIAGTRAGIDATPYHPLRTL